MEAEDYATENTNDLFFQERKRQTNQSENEDDNGEECDLPDLIIENESDQEDESDKSMDSVEVGLLNNLIEPTQEQQKTTPAASTSSVSSSSISTSSVSSSSIATTSASSSSTAKPKSILVTSTPHSSTKIVQNVIAKILSFSSLPITQAKETNEPVSLPAVVFRPNIIQVNPSQYEPSQSSTTSATSSKRTHTEPVIEVDKENDPPAAKRGKGRPPEAKNKSTILKERQKTQEEQRIRHDNAQIAILQLAASVLQQSQPSQTV